MNIILHLKKRKSRMSVLSKNIFIIVFLITCVLNLSCNRHRIENCSSFQNDIKVVSNILYKIDLLNKSSYTTSLRYDNKYLYINTVFRYDSTLKALTYNNKEIANNKELTELINSFNELDAIGINEIFIEKNIKLVLIPFGKSDLKYYEVEYFINNDDLYKVEKKISILRKECDFTLIRFNEEI